MAPPPATHQVTVSARALRDLTRIGDYIQRESPSNAILILDRTLVGMANLDLMPDRFRVGGLTRRGRPVHVLTVDPFLVYYRVDHAKRTVIILRIVHGARRQPRRF